VLGHTVLCGCVARFGKPPAFRKRKIDKGEGRGGGEEGGGGSARVFVCVCERESARERAGESICVCVSVSERQGERHSESKKDSGVLSSWGGQVGQPVLHKLIEQLGRTTSRLAQGKSAHAHFTWGTRN